MQVIPRWKNLFIIKNLFTHSTISYASFHSTPISHEKWKNKWNYDEGRDQKQPSKDEGRGQKQPSKSYIKYATRQKRADAKKALNDLLFNSGSFSGSPRITFEEETFRADRGDEDQVDHSDSSNNKARSKSSGRRTSKAQHKRMKRKFRKEKFDDFDEHPGTTFQATFGNRWYTWSFKSWEDSSSFQSSSSGFEWRENINASRNKEWDTASETDSDVESCVVGSCSERTLLGLPAKGPLKLEDVKNAFRLSALKWHPDKHQGPSQAMAEEKFKDCVNAYKSLCSAVSSV